MLAWPICVVKVREYVIYWKRPADILILLLQIKLDISMGRSLVCRAISSIVWSCAPCFRRSDSGDGEKESEKEKNSKELVPFPFFPAFFPLRSLFQTTLQCLPLEQPGADGTARNRLTPRAEPMFRVLRNWRKRYYLCPAIGPSAYMLHTLTL